LKVKKRSKEEMQGKKGNFQFADQEKIATAVFVFSGGKGAP